MDTLGPWVVLFSALLVIVLAARQMGEIFARFKLPLISGFLFVGIITGPFVLDFIHTENIPQFLLLDEMALAFIAFAAGAELEMHVIRGYFRSIISIISGQVIVVFAIGITIFILIKDMIPFMAPLPQPEVWAVALLGATIMIARSPSSALAIIKELRARGPFTHKVLGATVLKDAVVIVIFAAAVSVAAVLVEGSAFNFLLLFQVVFEIGIDIGLGILIGLLLRMISMIPFRLVKSALILILGLSVFVISTELHDPQLISLPIGLFSEPLLICMTAGFYVTNFTRLASDFQYTIEEMSPAVFLVFFTLVGIELELDVLGQTWLIVLILVVVRIVGIFVGSFAGTAIAGDRSRENALLGFGFITQAGVSVGLAKEIGVEFDSWGPELATLSIGVIVINQILGPPLLKWTINRVGESYTQAARADFDGIRDALIFGVENQSLALARQLNNHGWQAVLVSRSQENGTTLAEEDPKIKYLPKITGDELRALEMSRADSVVLLLTDDENYAICELIYEQFGVENVIVRLEDRANFEKFYELGANIIQPGTTMVSLLDQFVRSPSTASLLLGMDPQEQFLEIQMNNPELNGMAVRDINFPHDTLLLSISRQGDRVVSHGYTRLKIGDQITVVGSPDSLAELEVKFEG
ncbi:MAG: cation:proton antiporter [Ardenticatenaceae bacterium]|nr:cation:proton antiporter [Ardenticatenaceae bacterium]